MTKLEKLKIGVPKRALLFLASSVWAIAGFNILKIALEELSAINSLYIVSIVGGIIGYILFFKLVFFKMYKKHTKRIINIEIDKPCMFSFFDIKGYIIMIFMITMGLTLRATNMISGSYLIILYLSLGLALISASIAFLIAGINYDKTVNTYKINLDLK